MSDNHHKRTFKKNTRFGVLASKLSYKYKKYRGTIKQEDKHVHLDLEKMKYRVVFVTKSPQKLDPINVDFGQNIPLPELNRHGYIFEGWFYDSSYTNPVPSILTVTGNTKIFAKWVQIMHAVTFIYKDPFGNIVQKSRNISLGGSAPAPSIEKNPIGYTFVKWNKPFDNITEPITVTAQYTINQYRVRFLDWDGISVIDDQLVNFGESATAPADPERTGYSFSRWDKPFDNIIEDIEVTAEYKIKKHTVRYFDINNNLIGNIQMIIHGEDAVAPSPPFIPGHTFMEWNHNGKNITNNTDIFAIYGQMFNVIEYVDHTNSIINNYSVTFGSVRPEDPPPLIPNYEFSHWSPSPKQITSDSEFSAVYTKIMSTLRIMVVGNGIGSARISNISPNTTTQTFTLNKLTADQNSDTISIDRTINTIGHRIDFSIFDLDSSVIEFGGLVIDDVLYDGKTSLNNDELQDANEVNILLRAKTIPGAQTSELGGPMMFSGHINMGSTAGVTRLYFDMRRMFSDKFRVYYKGNNDDYVLIADTVPENEIGVPVTTDHLIIPYEPRSNRIPGGGVYTSWHDRDRYHHTTEHRHTNGTPDYNRHDRPIGVKSVDKSDGFLISKGYLYFYYQPFNFDYSIKIEVYPKYVDSGGTVWDYEVQPPGTFDLSEVPQEIIDIVTPKG